MTPRNKVQAGQGFVESLLLLGALVALLFGLHFSATLRQLTLVALQESTLAVFIGRTDARVAESPIAGSHHQRDTENELLGSSSGRFLRATDSQRLPATSVGQFYLGRKIATAVQRHSYIYAGDGRSLSSQSIHVNIGNSHTFWQSVVVQSRRLAEQVITRTKYIDAVWRRARPQLDWLGAWRDLTPRYSVW
jgi:hypothetical protein